jgi:hypothetical protein
MENSNPVLQSENNMKMVTNPGVTKDVSMNQESVTDNNNSATPPNVDNIFSDISLPFELPGEKDIHSNTSWPEL